VAGQATVLTQTITQTQQGGGGASPDATCVSLPEWTRRLEFVSSLDTRARYPPAAHRCLAWCGDHRRDRASPRRTQPGTGARMGAGPADHLCADPSASTRTRAARRGVAPSLRADRQGQTSTRGARPDRRWPAMATPRPPGTDGHPRDPGRPGHRRRADDARVGDRVSAGRTPSRPGGLPPRCQVRRATRALLARPDPRAAFTAVIQRSALWRSRRGRSGVRPGLTGPNLAYP
jgi:hypothetical protein